MDLSTLIEKEKTGTRIALLLSRYNTVHWSAANIIVHVGCSTSDATNGIEWLRNKLYIAGREQIFLTEQGTEFVAGLRVNPHFQSAESESKFKTEALTGMTQVRSRTTGFMISEPSALCAAVLTSCKRPATHTTPEDIMLDRQRAIKSKRYLMASLSLSLVELEKFIDENRVRLCNKCQEIGVFDKKGEGRFQPKCRKCQKAERDAL